MGLPTNWVHWSLRPVNHAKEGVNLAGWLAGLGSEVRWRGRDPTPTQQLSLNWVLSGVNSDQAASRPRDSRVKGIFVVAPFHSILTKELRWYEKERGKEEKKIKEKRKERK